MADTVRKYVLRTVVEDTATPKLAKLQKQVADVGTEAKGTAAELRLLDGRLADCADSARDLDGTGRRLVSTLGELRGPLSQISSGLGRVDFNAGAAAKSLDGTARAAGELGGKAAAVGTLQAAVQKAQRSTYGLMKNAEGAAGALGRVGTAAGGIDQTATAARGLGRELKTSDGRTSNLLTSLGGFSAASIGVDLVKDAAVAMGQAFNDARTYAKETAEESLSIRDSLREIANLSKKSGPDDDTVEEHLQLRERTGMNAGDARGFSEQFKGSLPLATDKGGITEATAAAMAPEIGRLAVRTGLDGKTAGDLAGSMGAFGQVKTAKQGVGQAQQIVDLLNDGRGNLTPLVKELMKGAASSVGEGQAFRSLQERAAAISVATGIGAVGSSNTNLAAAIRGLGGFDKEQGGALKAAGIQGTDTLMARIDKIAPLVEGAKARGLSADQALMEAGFGNQTDRRAIVGLVSNRDTLRARIASVAEDPNRPGAVSEAAGDRSAALNDRFFDGDKAARARVATAREDAARLRRGRQDENLEIERKNARARMTDAKQLDTPMSNFNDSLRDGFGILPRLGFQASRDARVDAEVRRAAGVGMNAQEAMARQANPLGEGLVWRVARGEWNGEADQTRQAAEILAMTNPAAPIAEARKVAAPRPELTDGGRLLAAKGFSVQAVKDQEAERKQKEADQKRDDRAKARGARVRAPRGNPADPKVKVPANGAGAIAAIRSPDPGGIVGPPVPSADPGSGGPIGPGGRVEALLSETVNLLKRGNEQRAQQANRALPTTAPVFPGR